MDFLLNYLFLTSVPRLALMAKVQKNPTLKNEQEDMLIKNKSNVSSSVLK